MRDWLVAKRKDQGMSQKDVAKAVRIAQPSYCNIEKGERSPSVEVAKRIAAVLKFEWTYFYGEAPGGREEGA